MKIIEKIVAKKKNLAQCEGVTIAFLGDSVTQGCFEIYKKENNSIETVFEQKSSYERTFSDILAMLFPAVPINVINAGISGDTASNGLKRVERDVLRHEPDLTVVCYGLNDCSRNEEKREKYLNNLRKIFTLVLESGSELVFMTPNMMNTKISPHITDPDFIKIAEDTMDKQNGVNTTELLSNKINHPTREMNKVFAYELVRTLFSN